jgi:preprotein translocase subunit SecF
VAYKHGLEVSFAPKIIVGQAGSGMHFHTRLVKDGVNLMADDKGLTDTARKVIAGYLMCSESLTAFGNTVPTSFLRLVPHQEAPTSICWGDRNRSVLVRVPLRGDGKQQEVVSKVFGAMCAAEGGAVRQEQFVDNKGETLTRPACRTPQGQEPVQFKRSELVGPQVGSELARDGALALLATVAGIVLYLAIRFEWKYAVSAIIANLHDVVIILGFFAFFGWEFSLAVLAGVLAVLGYSVNESVVIFDRIRETFRKQRLMSPREVIDHAITTTTSRTIITHGATQMMVLAMLFFGGQTLHYFAMALTIGICFGIYSSVFVAAAIAMWLGIRREDLIPSAPKAAEDGEDPNSGAVV